MYADLIDALQTARTLTPAGDVGTLSMLNIMINYYEWKAAGGVGAVPMTPGP